MPSKTHAVCMVALPKQQLFLCCVVPSLTQFPPPPQLLQKATWQQSWANLSLHNYKSRMPCARY